MDYRMIPTKPGLFKDLEQVKGEAEREVGAKINWNTFLLVLLVGTGTTLAGIAIGKAIERWRQKKKQQEKKIKKGGEV